MKNAGICRFPRHYACVDGLANVEGRLTMNRNMLFEDEPETGTGPNLVRYRWTNVRSLDQHTANGGEIYRWVDNVVVHEFGHTFGLDDYRGESDFYGIMDVDDVKYKKDDQIKQDDRDALRKIYESHTKNEGW